MFAVFRESGALPGGSARVRGGPRFDLTWATLCVALLVVGLLACGPNTRDPRDPLPDTARPVLDGAVAPDVLVESEVLEHPPNRSGNRFLSGWRPGAGSVLVAPSGKGRIEIVRLTPRHRTLRLELVRFAPADLEPAAEVVVEHAGRELDRRAVGATVELDLPDDLPLGRVPLDLRIVSPDGSDVALEVRSASLSPATPSGVATWQPSDGSTPGWVSLVGYVRVDVPQALSGPAQLVGRFVPPAKPRPGQAFHLDLERPGETPERLFSWPREDGQDLDVELDPIDRDGLWTEFVRLRLVSEGDGPPGVWRDLAWIPRAAEDPSAPDGDRAESEDLPTPSPRLVVLYVFDALRADAVGHLGGPPGVAPNLDRLAEEGVVLRDHHSVAPHTLASTSALFLGRTVRRRDTLRRLRAQAPEEGPPTLAERFASAGYTTALFSGNVFVGPAFGTARGFEVQHHLPVRQASDSGSVEDTPFSDHAAQLHTAALEWIDGQAPESQLFVVLHVVHPHNPYASPPEIRQRFAPPGPSTIDGSTWTLLQVRQQRQSASLADQQRLRDLYHAGLAYADQQLGVLVAELAQRFVPEEQLLVVTSDHGEELFDHGGVLHGTTLYQEQLRIPGVLWGPGRLQPTGITHLTNTLDLRASLLDLAGIRPETNPRGSTEGRSVLRHLPPSQPVTLFAAAAREGGLFSARTRRWKLVRAPRRGTDWGMGHQLGRQYDAEALFDLSQDPREQHNLAGAGDLEAAWLRARLLAWIDTGLPAASTEAEPETKTETELALDPATRRQLEALGYLD